MPESPTEERRATKVCSKVQNRESFIICAVIVYLENQTVCGNMSN